MIATEEKTCNRCAKVKALNLFPLGRPRVDGTATYQSQCKSCKAEKYRLKQETTGNKRVYQSAKEWKSANPEHMRAQKECADCQEVKNLADFYIRTGNKDGRSKRCKKCDNARNRSTLANNPLRVLKNRDRASKWQVDNHQRYRAGHIERNQVRRSRKQTQLVEHVSRSVLWESDLGICRLCERPADPADWHMEHLTPLSRGGDHSYANCAVSHPACNLSKGSKTLDEWRSLQAAA